MRLTTKIEIKRKAMRLKMMTTFHDDVNEFIHGSVCNRIAKRISKIEQ